VGNRIEALKNAKETWFANKPFPAQTTSMRPSESGGGQEGSLIRGRRKQLRTLRSKECARVAGLGTGAAILHSYGEHLMRRRKAT
jgi:hypothetical protein